MDGIRSYKSLVDVKHVVFINAKIIKAVKTMYDSSKFRDTQFPNADTSTLLRIIW